MGSAEGLGLLLQGLALVVESHLVRLHRVHISEAALALLPLSGADVMGVRLGGEGPLGRAASHYPRSHRAIALRV